MEYNLQNKRANHYAVPLKLPQYCKSAILQEKQMITVKKKFNHVCVNLFNIHPLISLIGINYYSSAVDACPDVLCTCTIPVYVDTMASKHQHLDFFAESFIWPPDKINGASLVVLVVKNLLANPGDIKDADSIPGQEDPLEEGMATHSSILAWRIPWTEEPGGLQNMWSQRVKHD